MRSRSMICSTIPWVAGRRAFSFSSPMVSRVFFQVVLMNFLVNCFTRNLRVHALSHSLFIHLAVRSLVM